MKKTRVAAKLLAGVAVAAALVLGSTTASTNSANGGKDTGWFSVSAGPAVHASPSADTGWF